MPASTTMIQLSRLVPAVILLGVAQACYYYYYIEDLSSFAYRYCSVGCGQGVSADHEAYAQCCVPLSSGAPTPGTCTALASSASAAGTICSWSSVATTDMPTSFPAPTTRSSLEKCSTIWVTVSASSNCEPIATQSETRPHPTTSMVQALPTSSMPSNPPADTSAPTIVSSSMPSDPPAYTAPTIASSSMPSNPPAYTSAPTMPLSSTQSPTCHCPDTTRSGEAGAPPSYRLGRRTEHGDCVCPNTVACPCVPRDGSQMARPDEPWGKRDQSCDCYPSPTSAYSPLLTSCPCRVGEQRSRPDIQRRDDECDCPPETVAPCAYETREGNQAAPPPSGWIKRNGGCQCPSQPAGPTATPCSCPDHGSGAKPPAGFLIKRGEEQVCQCSDYLLPVAIAPDEQFDQARRALPPDDFVPDDTAALPTISPGAQNAAPTGSCMITRTTTVAATCTSTPPSNEDTEDCEEEEYDELYT